MQKEVIKGVTTSIVDYEYLSHLSLLRRHGPQFIVFLARLAGTLTWFVLEKSSRDEGDRGRVIVEVVFKKDRASEASLRERSVRLVGDGSISGGRGKGGVRGKRSKRSVKL